MPGVYLELKGSALVALNKARDEVKKRASNVLNADYELRDSTATDFKLSNPAFLFNVTTASNWNTLVNNQTINNNRWIALYGLSYPETTPLISELKITTGGGVKMWRNVQHVPFTQDKVEFFDPVIIDQNTGFTLEAYNRGATTATGHQLILFGVTAEKRGMTLTY